MKRPHYEVVALGSRDVLLSTCDWAVALDRALPENWPDGRTMLCVLGTHPSHDWDLQCPPRCRECGGWQNGSYGSVAPCGYDWARPLAAVLKRELEIRRLVPRSPDGACPAYAFAGSWMRSAFSLCRECGWTEAEHYGDAEQA